MLEETREANRIDGRDALLVMLGIDPDSVDDDIPLDDDTELEDVEEEVIDTIELSESQAEAITRLLEHGMPVVRSKRSGRMSAGTPPWFQVGTTPGHAAVSWPTSPTLETASRDA